MKMVTLSNTKITTAVINYNTEKPSKENALLCPIHKTHYPEFTCKNAEFDLIYKKSNHYIHYVLNNIKLRNKHKYVAVDVKVHDLKVGECPCIPGWHCDTTIELRDELPEVHHLFVTGEGCLTEFIDEPLSLKHGSLYELQRQIRKDVKVKAIDSCTITTYGRFDFHRGPIAKINEKRLLVRVTETDIIVPNRNIVWNY